MVIIGINGNPGSGKTTVSEMLFKEENTKVIHLDAIFNTIKAHMPGKSVTSVTRDDGNEVMFLTRNDLYKKVMSNKKLNEYYIRLRRIIGSRILSNQITKAQEEGYKYLIIEGISLFELGENTTFDFLIKMFASYDVRAQRVKKRNLQIEIDASDPMKTELADFKENYLIVNDSSLEDLESKVQDIEDDIKEQIKNRK